MKQTKERVKKYNKSGKIEYTTERFITYQGYKFFINSNPTHDIDMKRVSILKNSLVPLPAFSTTHLTKMMECLVDARNNLNNPHLTHITLHLNDGYVVSDITERLKRVAKDGIKYLWSLENKEGNVHIHLYLVIDIPTTVEDTNEYVHQKYTLNLKSAALKDIYNTQYKEDKPYYNLKKDDDFVKAVHYASYATKQTNKEGFDKGVRTFGTSKIDDRSQRLELNEFYVVHDYFKEIPISSFESFRVGLTIEKAGTYSNVYWSVRDFKLLPTTTPVELIDMLDDALATYLPLFIREHKLYLHSDDNIVESVQVLPTLHKYKKKITEIQETIIEGQSEHVPLIAQMESDLVQLVTAYVENCLTVKD